MRNFSVDETRYHRKRLVLDSLRILLFGGSFAKKVFQNIQLISVWKMSIDKKKQNIFLLKIGPSLASELKTAIISSFSAWCASRYFNASICPSRQQSKLFAMIGSQNLSRILFWLMKLLFAVNIGKEKYQKYCFDLRLSLIRLNSSFYIKVLHRATQHRCLDMSQRNAWEYF